MIIIFAVVVVVLTGCSQSDRTDKENNNIETVAKFHQNFNNDDFEANKELVTDDVTFEEDGNLFVGKDEFASAIQADKAAFPDTVITDNNIYADGNTVVVDFTVTATMTSPIAFSNGNTVEATNQEFSFNAVEVFTLNEDGLVTDIYQVNESGFGESSVEYQVTH